MACVWRNGGRGGLLLAVLAGGLAVEAGAQQVTFAGRKWDIRTWGQWAEPGPNYWATNGVWVDTNGCLHLKIVKRGGTNYCAEVVSTNSMGYGTYTWYVANRVDQLDTNVVGGLFTYANPWGVNEIDIEFTKAFTVEAQTNLHYTLQPYYTAGHQEKKLVNFTNDYTTHQFTWLPDYIRWQSWYGHSPTPNTGSMIADWTYTGTDVPEHADERTYMNMWLFESAAPTDTNAVEMILQDFIFTAMAATGTLVQDEFSDNTMSNIWANTGEPGADGLVESNELLRIKLPDTDHYTLGYHTAGALQYSPEGREYVFSASLYTVNVTRASTSNDAAGLDVFLIQSFISGSVWYDPWNSSNAASLRCGYDQANDSLTVEFYTKTNWLYSWGYSHFKGTIPNVSAYADTNGLELQFVLRTTNYYVRANYRTNGVTITPVSGSSTGVHALGHVLDGGSYLLGAANVWDGRGEVYWNRTRVYTGVATNPHIPPPPETNAPNVAQVGTNTLTTWRYPLDTNEKKTRLQALYLAGQIGKSGVITSLAIYVSGYPTITLPEYTIRLAHTPLNSLSNQWAVADWTTVFESNLNIGAVGWYYFKLATNFAYNGASNLLVDFSIDGSAKQRPPLGYARYSKTATNQSLGNTANVSTDPTTWTGTQPGSGARTLTNNVPNIRFVFLYTNAPVGSTFAVRDDFDDGATSNAWTRYNDWGGAEFEEAGGRFRVKPPGSDWQTAGYLLNEARSWSDSDGEWYVFAAQLSTIRVDAAQSGEDLRAVLSVCSEFINGWAATNAVNLHGRYDSGADTLTMALFTKTETPSSDGTERFVGTIANVSRYLTATGGIQMRVLLGDGRYAVRFADAGGQPIAITTDSGAATGYHQLSNKLLNAYWLVGAQNYGAGRGSVWWDWAELYRAAVPAVALPFAAQTSTDGRGLVTISNTYYDAGGRPGMLRVEASTNGGAAWFGVRMIAAAGTAAAALAPTQCYYQIGGVAATNGGGAAGTNRLALTWDTRAAGNSGLPTNAVSTNVRVRVIADNLALAAPAVTAAVFTLDNQPPSAAAAVVHIGDDAAFTFDASLSVNWSNFTDEGVGVARYYYSLANGAGTTNGAWTNALAAIMANPTVEAVNTVYVWAGDGYGNLGAAAARSIVVLGASGDYDADELANSGEAAYGCSPLDPDGDRDEMPDGWEVRNGLSPTNAADAGQNSDGDRYSNHDEFFWDTDPMDSNSWLVFKAGVSPDARAGLIQWGSSSNRRYHLQASLGAFSNNLNWAPIWTNVAGTGGWLSYTNDGAAPARSYRLRVTLP